VICGQLTGASDPNSVYTYSLDADGNITRTQVSYPAASGTVTLSYGFDTYGNRSSMSDSLGGSISYYHNTLNQLTYMFLNVSSMMVAELTFGYDSSYRLSTVTMSSMMGHIFTGTYSYDAATDLTGITYKDTTASTTLATFSYTYNAGSEISAYTGPDGSLSYTLDHDGQLAGVSGAHSETYSYDSNGNRNMASYIYTTGNENTADAAGNSFTEDDDGNVVTKTDSSGNVWTYTFDFHNRMTQVVEKNSGGTTIRTENMTYDVFGNLIGLAVNGRRSAGRCLMERTRTWISTARAP